MNTKTGAGVLSQHSLRQIFLKAFLKKHIRTICQGNILLSTSCVFTLQASLCAQKCLIWPFRGTPRTRFSNFSSFGTPRKLVFQNFEASGLPDGSFSQKTTRRGIPKHCFSDFLPFGMPRSTIFPVFRSSLASETLFLAIFDEKLRATGCFPRFLLVACKRNAVFGNF